MRRRKIIKLAEKAYESYARVHNSRKKDRYSFATIQRFCNKHKISIKQMEPFKTEKGTTWGRTDGKAIWITFQSDIIEYCYFIFWHEYAHYKLHFNKASLALSQKNIEKEADQFSLLMCEGIFPNHEGLFKTFVRENPAFHKTKTEKLNRNQLSLF